MRTIWHSLAWKEWHEHKWKLATSLAIIWSVTALVLLSRYSPTLALAEAYQFGLISCIVPLSVFIGLSAAAGEQSRGSIRFLQALPVPLWRVALSKIAFGLASVLVPILLTWMLAVVLRWWLGSTGVKATGGMIDSDTAIATVAAIIGTSLFVWAAAFGANRSDEVSAGAVALVTMTSWWLFLVGVWQVLLMGSTDADTARIRAVGAGSGPLGVLSTVDIANNDMLAMALGICSAALTHGLLAAWFIYRFGREIDRQIRSPRAATAAADHRNWLAPPRPGAVAAIAWKQTRESGPIVLVGLAGIIAVVVIFFISELYVLGTSQTSIGLVYSRVAILFGFFVALVVGIGVALHDMGPRLNIFWRSRPIHPDLWFATKIATGLGIVLAAIYVPILLLAALGSTVDEGLNYPNAIAIPAGQIAMFAAAVAMTCLVRNAVYAAILSIPSVYLGAIFVQMALVAARRIGWVAAPPEGLWHITDVQIAQGFALSFVVCTILAWLAMRYDWGWKGRY